jgi:hypothetical protein
MSEEEAQSSGGLPATTHVPALHHSSGHTFDIAGIPVPLKRTFDAIDRLIALPLETLGDYVEKRLKGNIDSHIDTVTKKREKRGKRTKAEKPSAKTIQVIAEWARNAAEVDPTEEDFAAVWRAILDQIMEDTDEGEELMRIVESLPRADVRFFLKERFIGIPMFTEAAQISRLSSAGLIRRLFPLTLLVFLGIAGFGPLITFYQRISQVNRPQAEILVLAAFAVPAMATLMYQIFIATRSGRLLGRLYRMYRDDKDR